MQVIQQLIPAGHPNRPGRKIDSLRAVIVHYTANDAPNATDTMNAKWFARGYTLKDGKPQEKWGGPFGFGSTHILCDADSVTMAIPTDEVAWGCGDRPLPYESHFKGQKPAARYIFGNRQNYHTVSVEICNNTDWNAAAGNAAEWIAGFIRSIKRTVDVGRSLQPQEFSGLPFDYSKILILRHHDVTGKICPKPFVDSFQAWEDYVRRIAAMIG